MAAQIASSIHHKSNKNNVPLLFKDLASKNEPRINLKDSEFNRVLGGGLVPGSIVLLGGEPGIGKSTLTLQTILNLSELRILYVSGEESAHQLKMRAQRISNNDNDHCLILCETSLENIFTQIQEVKPRRRQVCRAERHPGR